MAGTTFDARTVLDKLECASDWSKWKWQMNMVFRSYGLEGIVYGECPCPEISDASSEQEKKEFSQWQKNDARAASIIAAALSRPVTELVLTCTHAKDIWDRLCARFERPSSIRLNNLIETFFRSTRNPEEDTSTHIAKLQKLFIDLNDELKKQNENTLSEKMLIGRILSTLEEEYNNFKDEWVTIPLKEQTVDLLIEKLSAIEMRSESTASPGSACAARKSNSQKPNKASERSEPRRKKESPKSRFH